MNKILLLWVVPLVIVTGVLLIILNMLRPTTYESDFPVSFRTIPGEKFFKGDETVPIETPAPIAVIAPTLYKYIEVTEGCGPDYDGGCVNMRSGPGEEYPVVAKLRMGMVLRVAETVAADGRDWYRIQLDSNVRYPERVSSKWYVAADFVSSFMDEGDMYFEAGKSPTTTKRILVDRSEQKMYAYDGDVLFMEQSISTGLDSTPTPRGTFSVYKKTPSRYMQGPLPGVSEQYYDLPGVPWNLYFTEQGAVVHGAYWHNSFGKPWSHGCVNLPPAEARKIYEWAEVGTKVVIRD